MHLVTHRAEDVLSTQLIDKLTQCRALLGACSSVLGMHAVEGEDGDVQFSTEDALRCNALLRRIGTRHGLAVPTFIWPAPQKPISLETALSKFVGLTLQDWKVLTDAPIDDVLDKTIEAIAVPQSVRQDILRMGGLPAFSAYICGTHCSEAFFIIPPCGVPAAMFYPWMEVLGRHHFVVMLENPYLFGDWRGLATPSGEIADEVAFIHAAVEAYGLEHVHFIGICGGAPVALAAAATAAARAVSVSVCHGDLYLGPSTPRTPFQRQFQGLLSEGAFSLARAAELHALFLDPAMLFGVPDALAPFILYPYADVALFHRYAKCNFALMAYDATQAAQQITGSMLVVTSKNDRMTHPEASRMLHGLVSGSCLWERENGSHHDSLLPNAEMLSAITAFAKKAS